MIDPTLIFQFFALINPVSSFSVLVSAQKQGQEITTIARKAVLIAYVLAISMVFIGPFLFPMFGISIDSFRIAGGIVLFLLGIDTLRPPKEDIKETGQTEALISIIATPLLTGPATISFITIKLLEIGLVPTLINLTLAFLAVAIVVLGFAHSINRLNMRIVSIGSRVFGLFLTAIAIEMIARGIHGVFLLKSAGI